jgi:hypothetical protein
MFIYISKRIKTILQTGHNGSKYEDLTVIFEK